MAKTWRRHGIVTKTVVNSPEAEELRVYTPRTPLCIKIEHLDKVLPASLQSLGCWCPEALFASQLQVMQATIPLRWQLGDPWALWAWVCYSLPIEPRIGGFGVPSGRGYCVLLTVPVNVCAIAGGMRLGLWVLCGAPDGWKMFGMLGKGIWDVPARRQFSDKCLHSCIGCDFAVCHSIVAVRKKRVFQQ